MKDQTTCIAAGALAALPMSAVMMTLHEVLPEEKKHGGELPPVKITHEILRKTNFAHHFNQSEIRTLALIPHLFYGALGGLAFSAIVRNWNVSPRFSSGALFGVGVWAISYLGWVPALRLLQPIHHAPLQRSFMMILASAIWGGAIPEIYHLIEKRDPMARRRKEVSRE